MDGIFLRKKNNFWLAILLICGLFFIGLYIFLNIVDSQATGELLIFLVMGILLILVVIPSWLLNFGAFIHIDEDSVKAKYHWFGRINCKPSDVTFALARINTLIIQLRDGKTHTITGVENPWPLCSALRRNMSFEVTEQPEAMIKKLNEWKATKKNGLIYVCAGVVLMFIIIFVTVFLTDEREMHQFSNVDWLIFAAMGVLEIATVAFTFYCAKKTGENNIPIERLQYEIRRKIIETQPLLPGYVIAVYTDDDYGGRVTLFGDPDDSAVYYSVQNIDAEYNLVKVYASETFEDREVLASVLDTLIDITEKVLH